MQLNEDETLDGIGSGAIRIIQKKNGYRFSLDAILLASFVTVDGRVRVLDIGTGSGVILLILLSRKATLAGVGVEIQPQLAEMASRNLVLNNMQERAYIVNQDIGTFTERVAGKECFDLICFNPPYRLLGSGKINQSEEKAIARHEQRGSLSAFLLASRSLINPRGEIYFIYPASRFNDVLGAIKQAGMYSKAMVFVHSHQNSVAELVLWKVSQATQKRAQILPPIFLYADAKGRETEQMRELVNSIVPASGDE
ncbi:MAG: methyltransferase [Deltaproteobacteria bacterium]|nr:methyltransferase [Deltaproteobacteria bacterium]